ncbi:hypothetical protein V8B97DRAFT_1920803 [Scleroderma yunnanense]
MMIVVTETTTTSTAPADGDNNHTTTVVMIHFLYSRRHGKNSGDGGQTDNDNLITTSMLGSQLHDDVYVEQPMLPQRQGGQRWTRNDYNGNGDNAGKLVPHSDDDSGRQTTSDRATTMTTALATTTMTGWSPDHHHHDPRLRQPVPPQQHTIMTTSPTTTICAPNDTKTMNMTRLVVIGIILSICLYKSRALPLLLQTAVTLRYSGHDVGLFITWESGPGSAARTMFV